MEKILEILENMSTIWGTPQKKFTVPHQSHILSFTSMH